MILSSDELDILHYLKSWNGKFVPALEVCRRAGGRRRFEESPNWAKSLMTRLVEVNLVEVNERGHYRFLDEVEEAQAILMDARQATLMDDNQAALADNNQAALVDDNYFPAEEAAPLVDGDYFPTQNEAEGETSLWISPHIAEILKKAGKQADGDQKKD
jgi:hypothetical protein